MSSLEKSLAILGLLRTERAVLRVGEVCRELSMPKSSVSRLLGRMCAAGLVERDGREPGYLIGPRVLQLAQLYMARHSLAALMEAALDRLIATFGFTGYLSALSGAEIVLLRVRQGSYPLRYVRETGSRLPAAQTAMGLALLARLTDEEVRKRLDQAGASAQRSTDLARLPSRLAAARRRGIVVAPSVLMSGISTISAAVLDEAADNLVAMGLAYPTKAVDRFLRRRIEDGVLEQAGAIGREVKDPFWAEIKLRDITPTSRTARVRSACA
ncbi:MAG: IclR family transcriptional regulator [Hyphomicrobiales bacterium]